jgi:hypothetical protein
MRYRGFVLLCLSCLAAGQTSRELHSRYGDPDTERFTVRPGIGATIQYGQDALACQIVIEALLPLVRKDQTLVRMRSDTVTDIIDELAPVKIRGAKVNAMYEYMGCARGEVVEYSNLVISRSTDECLPLKSERETSARITFKRPTCPPPLLFFQSK